jgi:ectoine hydroxylase-related dioxygenase (phytanoyl-CoA dioxygenase family)
VLDLAKFERDGFAIVDRVAEPALVASLIDSFEVSPEVMDWREKRHGLYAMRQILGVPDVYTLATSPGVRAAVEEVLGKDARPVRGIFFDKLAGANWKVAWHQDRAIAVAEKIEVDGFGPWSMKESVVHVQPPVEVLERMVTVRVHLDECGSESGPLKVLRGSHRMGIIAADQVARVVSEGEEVACEVPSGGAVVMRPLILHRSGRAVTPGHRRVVHIEFAAQELPGGLQWAEQLEKRPTGRTLSEEGYRAIGMMSAAARASGRPRRGPDQRGRHRRARP